MLIALHGGGGDADFQSDDAKYKLISKSEQAGFIAVFPNGYSRMPSGILATWNAGNCCARAQENNVDDVGFIRAVIARMETQANIDRRRIFATGMYEMMTEMQTLAFRELEPDAYASITRRLKQLTESGGDLVSRIGLGLQLHLADHDGLGSQRAKVAETKDRGAVGNDGDEIALCGQVIGLARIFGDGFDRNRDTRRIG